jgi:DNA-binding transcriptional MerR regulator
MKHAMNPENGECGCAPAADAAEGWTIGRLARHAGVGVETIRFYEREGLIPEPARTGGNYRMYGAEAFERLCFIRHAKELGFTLDEIRRLLALSRSSRADAGDFHALAREKIDWIRERIAQLERMQAVLSAAVESCPGHGADKAECPILHLFTHGCPHGEGCRCGDCTHCGAAK